MDRIEHILCKMLKSWWVAARKEIKNEGERGKMMKKVGEKEKYRIEIA